jgi:RNA polymerase sigma factor (sigma-70 family)
MDQDRDAFEDVFAYLDKTFRAPLRAYVNRKFRRAADADVVVQETFVRAAKKYGETKLSEEQWHALVFKIAKNIAIDGLKTRESKLASRSVGLESLEPEPGHPDGNGSTRPGGLDPNVALADGPAERYWKNELFYRRMMCLEPLQRKVLILVGVQGFTQKETARQLGLSINQVRYAWSKGGIAYARISKVKGPRAVTTGGAHKTKSLPPEGDNAHIAPETNPFVSTQSTKGGRKGDSTSCG